jgi:hypothetical protein
MRTARKTEDVAEAPERRGSGAGTPAARVLLDRGWVRRAATAALLPLIVLGSCVLPSNGLPPPDDRNFPPEVSLDELSPAAPITRVSLERTAGHPCIFDVKAGSIIDRDSSSLRFRWVADNRSSIAKFIKDEVVPLKGPTLATHRLVPSEDFLLEPISPRPHSLSLFITDAPGWAVPNPQTAPQETDLGRIVDLGRDGGVTPGASASAVIEVRWVFEFVSGFGVCP